MSGAGGSAESGIDVEFRHVTRRFGALTAIDGVDLQVRQGESLCLFGPPGCGKTTALRLMAGVLRPDEGVVLIGGIDAVVIPPYWRAVEAVLHNPVLFPRLAVLDNVTFGLRQRHVPRAERRARAREALGLVGLTGYEEERPPGLSRGQQRRVALARSLVLRPRVLLLDEPCDALDRGLRQELRDELRRIQRRCGVTFVHATCDREEALAVADRVAVMQGGHVERLGETKAVLRRRRPVAR
jgi:ABC-type Fe3+/spermidine/putrescine transport system ATPase subunit